ncbi:MAG: hypothetical protein NVS2B7_17460 [Herpetosiphon sp.]
MSGVLWATKAHDDKLPLVTKPSNTCDSFAYGCDRNSSLLQLQLLGLGVPHIVGIADARNVIGVKEASNVTIEHSP